MSSSEIPQLLTFELGAEKDLIEIHCNQEGLKKLKHILDSLLLAHAPDHIHLMSKEWGGNDLSDEKQCSENEIVHHVKIFKWD